MKDNKFVIGIVAVTLVLAVGLIWGVTKMSGQAEVASSTQVEAFVEQTNHDWGTISIDAGKVTVDFDIKNNGTEPLSLFNVATSCTCTTAQLKLGDAASPLFGMHTKSAYAMAVPPGETAQIQAVFDPAFHGPGGVGPISRQVTVQTNDAARPVLTFLLSANVVK